MRYGTEKAQLAAAWRWIVATMFALAAIATPALAFAQGTAGGSGGTGSGAGGTGGAPGGAPSSGAPSGTDGGGGSGLAWIVLLLAIAVAIWLFTRRRGGTVER